MMFSDPAKANILIVPLAKQQQYTEGQELNKVISGNDNVLKQDILR